MIIVFPCLAVITDKSFFQLSNQSFSTQLFFFSLKKNRFKILAEQCIKRDARGWNKIKKYGKTVRKSGRKEICGEGAED